MANFPIVTVTTTVGTIESVTANLSTALSQVATGSAILLVDIKQTGSESRFQGVAIYW